jgi:hypothetical protein
MSKMGTIIVVLLAVAIGVVYFTGPKKPAPTIKVPDNISRRDGSSEAEQMLEENANPPARPVAAAPPAQPPAELSVPPVADAAAMAASVSGDNMDLLRERYGRDNPFAPLYDIPAKTAVSDRIPTLPLMQPVLTSFSLPVDFKLSAIALRNGKGIAVIDGEILRVGDSIRDYTVANIRQDQVLLRGSFGDKIVLKLKQELRGVFDASNKEISNINIMKTVPTVYGRPAYNSNEQYSPGPLPPLPEYSIPGPDDIQPGQLPSSGTLP